MCWPFRALCRWWKKTPDLKRVASDDSIAQLRRELKAFSEEIHREFTEVKRNIDAIRVELGQIKTDTGQQAEQTKKDIAELSLRLDKLYLWIQSRIRKSTEAR